MSAPTYQSLSIYITAHPDDWQLFMMPNAVNDLSNPSTRVVWIQLTAGDAGMPSPYWLAREQGAISSIRYVLAQADGGYFIPPNESEGTLAFNGHPIRFWSSKNAAGYYLRLPDGNLDGSGYQVTGYQSLERLRENCISEINSIDGTAKYTLPDLVATLNAIVAHETAQANLTPTLNYQNPDTKLNTGDHSDHTNTGLIVQQMPLWHPAASILYLDYVVNTFPPDIAIADLYWKASLFAAYEKSVHDLAGHSDSNPKYEQFCLRTARWAPGGLIVP
jgi:hypothetical protein